MPRLPRDIVPGTVYHLISRFVDRNWYITSEDQREAYLRLLGRALSESDWRCLAYGVMSNHIHLGAVAGRQPLDAWIRRVHSPFADWMNRTHARIGVMFVRGPKARPTPDDEVGALIAYIHNNPVRAKLVDGASGSRWTSHRSYLGSAAAPPWLHVDEGLARAGFRDRAAFDRWVRDPDPEQTERIRVRAETEPVRAKPVVACPDLGGLVAFVAAEMDVPVAQLRSHLRGEAEVVARQVVVHCARSFGVSGAAVAVALRLSQQGVSKIGRRPLGKVAAAISTRVLRRLKAA